MHFCLPYNVAIVLNTFIENKNCTLQGIASCTRVCIYKLYTLQIYKLHKCGAILISTRSANTKKQFPHFAKRRHPHRITHKK